MSDPYGVCVAGERVVWEALEREEGAKEPPENRYPQPWFAFDWGSPGKPAWVIGNPIMSYFAAYKIRSRKDAVLMAAAPELCEALAELLEWQNGPPLVSYEGGWTAAVERAYAALAKADGRE